MLVFKGECLMGVVAVGLASFRDKGTHNLSREVREDKNAWLFFQRIQ